MDAKNLAEKIPNYPGRKALERAVSVVAGPLVARAAGSTVQRLLGHWTLMAIYGDLGGLVEAGVLSKSGGTKQAREFRALFGCEPHEFMPDLFAKIHDGGLAATVGYPQHVRPIKVAA